jgi:UDP-N-acetylmuramoyl-L-alanyl-D-glutamate--2,6-diaminopimelate ligase
MKLNKIIKNLVVKQIVGSIENVEIENLTDSSREKKANSLFIAIKGIKVDAHSFASGAIKNGAVALLVERKLDVDVPQIIVKNTRESLGIIANNFYNNPLKNIKVISIIGTNGKTTTSYVTKNILESTGLTVGVIGTSGTVIDGVKYDTNLTTPDTLELFEIFNAMKNKKVEVIVMEISAHAIKLNKVNGFKSDVAVFTNFSQDHLDFFDSLEEYKQVKMSYFNKNHCKFAVINADDPVGLEILSGADVEVFTYGIKTPASVFLVNLKLKLEGSNFVINLNDTVADVSFNLPAKFNVYNALASATACYALGLSESKIIKGLNGTHKVEGRFNLIKAGKNCNVIIDYAHTEVAIKNLLETIKSLTKSRIICVFGCPGNRDEDKRAKMGRVAGELCDLVILTTDNPDLENPLKIMDHIEQGVIKTGCQYKIIESRKLAIAYALSSAKKKERTTIVVVGKGDENYQIINNIKSPYNDSEEVKKLIEIKS